MHDEVDDIDPCIRGHRRVVPPKSTDMAGDAVAGQQPEPLRSHLVKPGVVHSADLAPEGRTGIIFKGRRPQNQRRYSRPTGLTRS